jgi:ethanolamine ammonia-lyase small subunit
MRDPWNHLRQHTAARIALGRVGGSVPTAEVLAFSAAHAAAQDAVHAVLDFEQLESDLRVLSLECVQLRSAAKDRQIYLQRPDLGRKVDDVSSTALVAQPADLALIISDGLSSPAAQRQAPALLEHLVPMLQASNIKLSPIYLVRHGRVAIEDEIGQRIGAKAALILLGERPGLGSADSLGAYLVFDPRRGRTDAQRNCVSNIRPGGLSFRAAAETLNFLILESLRRSLSGVNLKDDRVLPPTRSDNHFIE